MSDIVTVSIIAALGPIISIIVTALIKKWVDTVKKEVAAVSEKLDTVHKQINGHMSELIEVTKKAYKAEGKLEEKEETEAKEKGK